NVRTYGAGGFFCVETKILVRPELRISAGPDIVGPPCGRIDSGLTARIGPSPLHQSGSLAASFAAGCFAFCGATNGYTWYLPGKVTVWKPRNCQVTGSPTRTVTTLG